MSSALALHPFVSKALISGPALVLGLALIIFVHELGHFLVAKAFGVRVVTFSLGFGKRLWGFRRGDTDYRISLVPLGGYVRMGGEMLDERTGDPREFLSKPRWQRVLIYLAGPLANIVLAVVLIAGLFVVGTPTDRNPPVIGTVEEGSPAAAAGLRTGDRILALGSEEITLWRDVDFAVATSPGRPLAVRYARDGEERTTTLVPEEVPRDGYGIAGFHPRLSPRITDLVADSRAAAAGLERGDVIAAVDGQPVHDVQEFIDYVGARPETQVAIAIRRDDRPLTLAVVPADVEGVGRIGVYVGYYQRLPVGAALVESVRFNADIIVKTVQVLGKLFSREIAPQSAVAGPVGIADSLGRAAEQGLLPLLFTIAILSTSIAFVNLLPIPMLDGGHITILAIESVLRSDLSLTVKERVAQVGFTMLMMLMAAALFFDLTRYLPGS